MSNHRNTLTVSLLTLAVRSALAAMAMVPLAALADESAESAALTHPANTVELGATTVGPSSAKFGEYNGLNKTGTKAVGNVNIRGGSAYDQAGGTMRWNLYGTDLGTTSREFGAGAADQGNWSIRFGFDELRHNFTDTYQTPFQGVMGGNTFTLPNAFGIVNPTVITAASKLPAGQTLGTQLVGSRNLTPAQKAAFQQVDVSSTRKNSTFNAGYIFNDHWNLQFDYNHLEQSGAKLIAGSSSDVRTGAGAAGTWTKEAMAILMNPTNYKTDTLQLAGNWAGEQTTVSASYVSSFFRDGYDRLSWMNPIGVGSATTGLATTTLGGGYQPNMLSTMPSNNFNQINLTLSHALRPATRVTGGFSYGRNTQNESYLSDPALMQAGGTPQTSLNGLVVTKNYNLKLTDQSVKNLTLSAGFKVNERDNRTASNVYKMVDLGGGSRLEINTPYSNRKSNLEFAGDYRLDKTQNVRVSLDREDYKRWCNNVAGASTPSTTVPPALPNSAPSPAGANCVVVPSSAENRLGLAYRYKPGGDLTVNAGYTYSRKVASVDHNALTPLNDNATPNLTGIVNASDYKGYMAFFSASRIQDQLKAGVNWQATDAINLAVNGRYGYDRYTDSPLGVQNGRSASLNFDTAYSYSENGLMSVYFTQQSRTRNMLSGGSGGTPAATVNATSYANLVAPTNIWANSLTDSDRTLGVNARHKGLMGGKLELVGDLSLTVGKTFYHTDVPYLATCATAAVLSCGNTPEIYSKTVQLKLRGNYQFTKQSTLSVGYHYQKLLANDYFYNGYQSGFTPATMLPTNQQSGSYSAHAVTLSYLHTF